MKKILLVLFSLILTLGVFTACGKTEPVPETKPEPASSQEIAPETDGAKMISDNLYEVTFDKDYDYSQLCNEEIIEAAGLCSSVQYGMFRGRNLDWNYENDITYVIHTTANDERYANVSVSSSSFGDSVEKMYARSLDGINSEGLCINTNVTDVGPVYKAKTETKEDDMFAGHVMRLIIDKCATIEDCRELLDQFDLYGDAEHEYHWMITAKASKDDDRVVTAIVEMIYDEEQGVSRVNFDIHEDNQAIMTNFKTYGYDGTRESTGMGFGYERYKILEADLPQASSNRGTFDLMRKVFYSLCYDMYADNYWYSELNGTDLSDFYSADELKERLGEEVYNKCTNYDEFNKPHTLYNAAYMKGADDVHGNYERMGVLEAVTPVKNLLYECDARDGSCWITSHTSIYNVSEKTLALSVHEGVDLYYFGIEGK